MDANTITLLVQIGAQEAPAIIDAIKNRGGSVATVGPLLSADAQTIQSDIETLKGEQDPPPTQG